MYAQFNIENVFYIIQRGSIFLYRETTVCKRPPVSTGQEVEWASEQVWTQTLQEKTLCLWLKTK
jgi:hypothetical protein